MSRLTLAAPALLLLAACPAAAPPAVPAPSVETVTGQALGQPAAAMISGAQPVSFAALTFDGPVSTVARDAVLGGLGSARTFTTPRGSLSVRYAPGLTAADSPSESGSGARACLFTRVAASGTYVIAGGTGSFARAPGRGTYSLTFVTETERAADGACSPSGARIAAGDQVDFTAAGPLS
jgi:hypothetical protein